MRTASQAKIKNNNHGSIRLLLGGVSLVTLYFNTSLQDPFNTPKLIILLFTSGWLLGHIIVYYRKTPVNFKSTEFITLVLLVAFVSALMISLFNTDIFITGLVGDTQRRNGFLSYFA